MWNVARSNHATLSRQLTEAYYQLSQREIEINSLKSQLAKLQNQLQSKHHDEVVKVVTAWAQSNESFSKAILGLKELL